MPRLSYSLLIISAFLLFFALIFASLCTPTFIKADTSEPNYFSIVQISDTQFLSAYYPDLFNNLTTWIVNNSQSYNLKLVVHIGDIVDNATSNSQWINANNSINILLDTGIPYSWDAGNHDQLSNGIGGGNPNLDWLGCQYSAFNGTTMRTNSFWVDDIYDSKNTAVRFTYGSYPFLLINLEYLANSSAIAWMKDLLNKSSGSNVIVATHDYLNDTAGYGYYETPPTWENNLRTLLDGYPNVFLTLNGHDDLGSGANMTRVGNREEIFFNRQGLDNQKGAAAARIYTFNMTTMQVSVKTYVVYTQSYLTDPYNQFNFNVTLQRDDANNILAYSYFWVGPASRYHVSFSHSCSAAEISQQDQKWAFTNLTLNGITTNLSVTTTGANMMIDNCDPNNWINYSVTGRGTQTFSLERTPVTVYIDGVPASDGWNYTNGTLTVSGASSSVRIAFQEPTTTSIPNPTTTAIPTPSPSPPPTPSPKSAPTSTPNPTSTATPTSSLVPTVTPTPSMLNFLSWRILLVLTVVALMAIVYVRRKTAKKKERSSTVFPSARVAE